MMTEVTINGQNSIDEYSKFTDKSLAIHTLKSKQKKNKNDFWKEKIK